MTGNRRDKNKKVQELQEKLSSLTIHASVWERTVKQDSPLSKSGIQLEIGRKTKVMQMTKSLI